MSTPAGCGSLSAGTVDAWPVSATLRAVAGDPFSFRVQLRDGDGELIDVAAWEWRATVTTGSLRLDFEWTADDTGVRFWMRGDDTLRLPTGKPWPFDVACRQPTAGEGVMVIAGQMTLQSRVTNPLRNDPDLVPA
jgi:hypothetical protein